MMNTMKEDQLSYTAGDFNKAYLENLEQVECMGKLMAHAFHDQINALRDEKSIKASSNLKGEMGIPDFSSKKRESTSSMYENVGRGLGEYENLGMTVGSLVDKKNVAYGDSFNKCGSFLRLLYPSGIRPDQFEDMLCIVRVFDKMMRIATNKGAFDESPFQDIAGYALLGLKKDLGRPVIRSEKIS